MNNQYKFYFHCDDLERRFGLINTIDEFINDGFNILIDNEKVVYLKKGNKELKNEKELIDYIIGVLSKNEHIKYIDLTKEINDILEKYQDKEIDFKMDRYVPWKIREIVTKYMNDSFYVLEQKVSPMYVKVKVPADIRRGCIDSEFQYLNHDEISQEIEDTGGADFPDLIMVENYVPLISKKLKDMFDSWGIKNLYYKKIEIF